MLVVTVEEIVGKPLVRVNGVDPFNPATDFASSDAQRASPQYLLLHASGSAAAQFYALTGDVTNGVVIADPAAVPDTTLPMPVLTDLPIALWDERLSTAAVERELIAADVSRGKRKALAEHLPNSAAGLVQLKNAVRRDVDQYSRLIQALCDDLGVGMLAHFGTHYAHRQ